MLNPTDEIIHFATLYSRHHYKELLDYTKDTYSRKERFKDYLKILQSNKDVYTKEHFILAIDMMLEQDEQKPVPHRELTCDTLGN